MTQQPLQKKALSKSTATPSCSEFLQMRPFAQTSNTVTQEELVPPDLQAQVERASRFGHSYGKLAIQPKLTIGEPGDKYEQEADRVAAQVVQRINQPDAVSSKQEETVQRVEMPQESEIQMKSLVQRREAISGGEASTHLESAINRAKGGGQPLEAGLQRSMGQAMGADFSGVRVHTDAQSDQLNKSIQAKAFTTGQDVFFRQGAYEPGSRGGQELIAHELTHVVQQTGQAGQTTQRRIEEIYKSTSLSYVREKVLKGIVERVDRSVSLARRVIIGDPLLSTVKVKSGYLEEWRKTWLNYAMSEYQQIPIFFYARFGYAVETVACNDLSTEDFTLEGVKMLFQVQHGGTRPDIVLAKMSTEEEEAWIDITSEGSVTHVLSKNHSGWTKGRLYVAEVLYDMPKVTEWKNSPALTTDDKAALEKADKYKMLRQKHYQIGMGLMEEEFGESLAEGIKNKQRSNQLSRMDIEMCGVKAFSKVYNEAGIEIPKKAEIYRVCSILENVNVPGMSIIQSGKELLPAAGKKQKAIELLTELGSIYDKTV